jgi:hypothetical protein
MGNLCKTSQSEAEIVDPDLAKMDSVRSMQSRQPTIEDARAREELKVEEVEPEKEKKKKKKVR